MSRSEKWGKPSRRKDGHIGAKVDISIRGEGGCDGFYAIETHGLSSDQVAAEIERVHTFHDRRAGRMNGFRAIQAAPIEHGGNVYQLVDIIIKPAAGATHCTLYLDVRQIVGGEKVKVAGFPIRKLYHSPAELPSDEAVVALVKSAIRVETEDIAALDAEFQRKVNEKLKRKG